MKNSSIKGVVVWLATILFLSGSFATRSFGAVLNGSVTVRPLTPQEIKQYSLTGAQVGSGLTTVGVNQSVYLDALINVAVTNTDVPAVTWAISNAPVGSVAVLTNSPLGPNVPPYRMSDRASL